MEVTLCIRALNFKLKDSPALNTVVGKFDCTLTLLRLPNKVVPNQGVEPGMD